MPRERDKRSIERESTERGKDREIGQRDIEDRKRQRKERHGEMIERR